MNFVTPVYYSCDKRPFKATPARPEAAGLFAGMSVGIANSESRFGRSPVRRRFPRGATGGRGFLLARAEFVMYSPREI